MGVPAYNEAPWKYTHISTATTTAIKTAPGILHTVVVNTPGTTNTVTISDGAATIATYTAAAGTQTYDIGFNTGLSITTSATCDITVSWS